MILETDRMNDGLYIFLAIIAFIVTCLLIYLIYRSVKKEEKKFKEEAINYIDGLMSKAELISDVSAYISRSSAVEFSLLLIDIDKFSNIIEAFGKEESDKIIQRVVYILLDALPSRIELARVKDDQFVAFARGEYSHNDVEELAQNILETLRKPIQVYGDNEINITASIGIAYYPMHGRQYKELVDDAEIALYICKKQGGNEYKVYSMENMTESENLEYYNQIKKGMKNKEFCLYYQPMIDVKNQKLFAVEGLLRWNHPEHGLLSPYKFINIMEQSGDINWVGLWGLECLMTEYESLTIKYPGLDIKMTMNLSPKQLINPDLVSDFQKVLKKSRVGANNIVLEIEEFAIFERHAAIKQNLADLSKLGFKIAIDGFGLDYSTLAKLEKMPVDMIKIDNDYLTDEDNAFLMNKYVDMLVEYTNQENKIIVSEGIEDDDMMNRALASGLSVMQGYHFSKPISSDDLEEYIKNEGWKKQVVSEEIKEETIDTIGEDEDDFDPNFVKPMVKEKAQKEKAQPKKVIFDHSIINETEAALEDITEDSLEEEEVSTDDATENNTEEDTSLVDTTNEESSNDEENKENTEEN